MTKPLMLYKTIALRHAWWDQACPACGHKRASESYKEDPITWSDVLGFAVMLWGAPTGFFVQDFLICMEFEAGVMLTFCTKGPRTGEIDVSVDVDDADGTTKLQALMTLLRPLQETIRKDVDANGQYD